MQYVTDRKRFNLGSWYYIASIFSLLKLQFLVKL